MNLFRPLTASRISELPPNSRGIRTLPFRRRKMVLSEYERIKQENIARVRLLTASSISESSFVNVYGKQHLEQSAAPTARSRHSARRAKRKATKEGSNRQQEEAKSRRGTEQR